MSRLLLSETRKEFRYVGPFFNNRAVVIRKDQMRQSLINSRGEIITPRLYWLIGQPNQSGLVAAAKMINGGLRWICLRTKDGKRVFPHLVCDAYFEFCRNMARVIQGGKTFYIDQRGRRLFGKLQVGVFHHGLATAYDPDQEPFEQWFITRDGQPAFPGLVFDTAQPFNDNGLAVVMIDSGRFFLTLDGQLLD